MRNDEATAVMSYSDAKRHIADGYPYYRRLCCPDAEFVHCVCAISVQCPTHGLICVGSHD